MTDTELPTVRSVLAYAERLRGRAQRDRAADPYARPYAPSEASARKVYQAALAYVRRADLSAQRERPEAERQAEAAAMAVHELAARVVVQDREAREAHERAERAERRHARRQRQDRAERQANQAGLTLGARLDQATRGLRMLSETKAQHFGEEGVVIKGTGNDAGPNLAFPPDRYQTLINDARHLVFRLEEELDHARRRTIKDSP